MLNKVIEYALEKYAGDEAQATEFVEGFIKSASSSPSLLNRLFSSETSPGKGMGETVAQSVRKGFSGAIGKGMGELSIALGATGAGTVYGMVRDSNLHNKFLQALERAVNANQILKQAKKEKVLGYAETIFKFAPNVATDPNLLSSILANAIHGEGIDPMTIKTLTELEGRYKDNSSFSPKTYV